MSSCTTKCHAGQGVLNAALEYIDHGFSVIPVRRSNKRPYLESWREYQQRLPTHEEIEGWWKQWPDANVAIVTGTVSKLWVGDADGPRGIAWIDATLPPTGVRSLTGKGRHSFYRAPEGVTVRNGVRIAPEVDIRGEGGYVVVSPSIHENGHQYRWEFSLDGWNDLAVCAPPNGDRAPMSVDEMRKAGARQSPVMEPVAKGERNDTLARLAGKWIARGLDDAEVMVLARQWNSQNTPPLNDKELATTIESIRKAHTRNHPGEEDTDPSSWGDPQDLYAVDDPLPYPLEGLPPIIREAVEEVVAFTQCPVAMVAASALSALSTAVQGHIDVERADRLTGPVSLFFLSVADSGERKSTCDALFTGAIREYQAREEEKAAPAVKEYLSRYAAWEAKRAAILENIKRETKADKSTYLLENKLIQHQATQPEAPHYPHILLLDETPESLGSKLAKQWPAVAILSPEAGLVLGGHGMGKESAMRNMTLINVLWDGASIEVGRKTSGSYRVEDARLTLGLQVQEAALRSFFERSEGLSRGVGFMARFLFSWPETTMGGRMFQEPPDQWPRLERYLRRISDILDQPLRLTDRYGVAPEMIRFAPGAKAAWIVFHDAVEKALGPDGELYEVRDVAAKAADNLARLSALFHFLEGRPAPITTEAVELAEQVVAWHLTEALRLFNSVILTPELVAAGLLDRWLISYCRRHGVGEVPTTVAMQFGPGVLRSKDPLYAAVKALAEFNRARLVKGEGKKKAIAVNPALLR